MVSWASRVVRQTLSLGMMTAGLVLLPETLTRRRDAPTPHSPMRCIGVPARKPYSMRETLYSLAKSLPM